MTKAEIDAWRNRWARINELELADLRATSPEIKLQQLAALMASVDFFGWREALAEDDQLGYNRWQNLRTAFARRESLHA